MIFHSFEYLILLILLIYVIDFLITMKYIIFYHNRDDYYQFPGILGIFDDLHKAIEIINKEFPDHIITGNVIVARANDKEITVWISRFEENKLLDNVGKIIDPSDGYREYPKYK